MSSLASSQSTFVGGAEMARRKARKRLSRPSLSEYQTKRRTNSSPYPKSMKVNDRFFGSLLSSSTESLRDSESYAIEYQKVMQQACSLLAVPCIPTPAKLITSPLSKKLDASCSVVTTTSSFSSRASFSNAREFYMSKAPLILEECRFILSESIAKNANSRRDNCSFHLELVSMEERYPNISYDLRQYAPIQLNFRITDKCRERGITKYTRSGSVFLISQNHLQQKKEGNNDEINSFVLACVVPSYHSTTKSDDENILSLMIFNRNEIDLRQLSDIIDNDAENDVKEGKVTFRAVFLVTLISYLRQMEACLRQAKVPFMSKLLGQKKATHIRFSESSDEEEEIVDDSNELKPIQEGFYLDDDGTTDNTKIDGDDDDDEYDHEVERGNSLVALLDKLPKLNPAQERAAKSFLEARMPLHIVQGPPGTGKSTFLVNVICRRLARNKYARILVTAPTNRAVIVLAQRFLDVVNSCNDELVQDCNAVLVGVEDKLIPHKAIKSEPNYMSVDSLPSSLQSIFVYTWTDSIKNEYIKLLKSLKSSRSTLPGEVIKDATIISNKLCNSIPNAQTVIHYSRMIVQQLNKAFQEDVFLHEEFRCSSASPIDTAISHIEHLLEVIDEFEDVVPELLSTARVIFCTLSTAGASIMKRTRKIDDLLVDEAACATESEMTIPFHLRPDNFLAVGDPMQLPPTIMSPHAASLGLSLSMHDRLMNYCQHDFVMLDHQYRMKPQISSFPNRSFYGGKILDGENVISNYFSGFSLRSGPYSFINVPDGIEFQDPGGSYANREECTVVLRLVEELSKAGKINLDEEKLRIITFYQGQVNLLKRILAQKGYHGVMVATVDSSQGCESDVVIISFVRSSDKKGTFHATGFLTDDRRINVALTRARYQLVCVGNAKGTLGREGSEVLRSLVLDAEHRGCIV